VRTIVIDAAACKGCGLCVEVCKVGALAMGRRRSPAGYLMPDTDAAKCVACAVCELLCPDLAIEVLEGE